MISDRIPARSPTCASILDVRRRSVMHPTGPSIRTGPTRMRLVNIPNAVQGCLVVLSQTAEGHLNRESDEHTSTYNGMTRDEMRGTFNATQQTCDHRISVAQILCFSTTDSYKR